jgi:hypothetical protein
MCKNKLEKLLDDLYNEEVELLKQQANIDPEDWDQYCAIKLQLEQLAYEQEILMIKLGY